MSSRGLSTGSSNRHCEEKL
ncbi:MAG TPA: palindromic element RPE4 domain-containing protein [Rickettsia endosymbiont of Bembidion nr. Transversale]|nr:palindromic element RPE4 domain-containing protein [Rickettsia endosymbiont of Bembidion nr. Transversale]